MFDEASKLVLTIPTHVRNPEESSESSTAIFVIEFPSMSNLESLAYPHPDKNIRPLVIEYFQVSRFYSYFSNLFRVVAERVQLLIGPSENITYEDLVIQWYRHLDENDGENRRSLYDEVVDRHPNVSVSLSMSHIHILTLSFS